MCKYQTDIEVTCLVMYVSWESFTAVLYVCMHTYCTNVPARVFLCVVGLSSI